MDHREPSRPAEEKPDRAAEASEDEREGRGGSPQVPVERAVNPPPEKRG